MNKNLQYLVYIFAYPFLWCISRLPDRLFYGLSDIICWVIYDIFGYRKKIVRSNLQLSFPEKTESEIKIIEQKFYHHFCDTFLEMLKTLSFSKEEMQKRMIFPNKEVLQSFVDKKQSFILMCGHYNSYEWLLSLALHLNCPSYAIYTPITNVYFDRLIKRVRARFNAFLVSRYEINSIINKHKSSGEMCVYGLASDQSPAPTNKQYWRTFMGVYVPVFTGAERISKQFGIPVVYCNIQKIKRGYYQTHFEVITLTPNEVPDYEITDKFTELLENQIRINPENYLWSHNRFKYRKSKIHI